MEVGATVVQPQGFACSHTPWPSSRIGESDKGTPGASSQHYCGISRCPHRVKHVMTPARRCWHQGRTMSYGRSDGMLAPCSLLRLPGMICGTVMYGKLRYGTSTVLYCCDSYSLFILGFAYIIHRPSSWLWRQLALWQCISSSSCPILLA